MVLRGAVVVAAWLGLAIGCATPSAPVEHAAPLVAGRAVTRVEIPDVPFHAQQRDHCGPAVLAMALGASGHAVSPAEAADVVFTPGRAGSLQADMIGAARRHGRVPQRVPDFDTLLAQLAHGRPVVVFQEYGPSWWPLWHFALAIGFDLERGTLRLHTGRSEARDVAVAAFLPTWERAGRWAVTLIAPGELPHDARREAWLADLAELERVAPARDLELAWRSALARWPDAVAARVGLSNALIAQGRWSAAERVLRDAARRHPEAAAIWNNWAWVLAEQGRLGEAEAAARRGLQHAEVSRTRAALERTLAHIRERAQP